MRRLFALKIFCSAIDVATSSKCRQEAHQHSATLRENLQGVPTSQHLVSEHPATDRRVVAYLRPSGRHRLSVYNKGNRGMRGRP